MEGSPVRLILVDLSPAVGLAERSLWELATRLRPERYAVRAWLSGEEGASGLAEALESRGVSVQRFFEGGSRWDWRTPFRLWLELRRERPQLLHVHDDGSTGSLRIARAAQSDGLPVVITRHDPGAPPNDPERRKVYAHADAVAVAARSAADALARAWLVERERIRWIPYGTAAVDSGAEAEAACRLRGIAKVRVLRPLWVCPLRLEPRRGHERLLEALGEVRRRSFDFSFVFAGDGPLRPELERSIRERGLSGSVGFADAGDSVALWIAAADAVAFPAFEGPLPLTLLDAMARGRPVVATDAAGMSDVIEDGVTGRVVPSGDAEAFAAALAGFHARPDLARRLGELAASRVAESFTWERIVEAYEGLYDEVLGLASFVPGGHGSAR